MASRHTSFSKSSSGLLEVLKARLVAFGLVEIDGRTYDHDVLVEHGRVSRRRKKASKPERDRYGHTPLTTAEPLLLFHNDGQRWTDVSSQGGPAFGPKWTARGLAIGDFDNDGHKDLFAACASILDNSEEVDHLPSKLPNLLLRNLGNGTFVDVSADAGPGFLVPAAHRGAAFGDLNNDGKMDIVVTNQNSKPEILMNRSQNANHWLIVKLVGTKSNRDGLGARIKVWPSTGPAQYNHATTSVGYGGSSDRRVHFGLGAAASAESIEIQWPSGTRQVLKNVQADQILNVQEPR